MRARLRSAASITTVASAYPLITALRIGKDALVGDEPGRNCETRSPFAAISSCRLAFCGGYARSIPVPMTATVRPPAASAAVCTALSIPAARPLMTGTPLAASPVASWRAWSMPLSVGWRVPTTATDAASRVSAVPRMNRTGGGWWIIRRLDGYPGSRTETIRMPERSHCSRSLAAFSAPSASVVSNSEPWAGSSPPHALPPPGRALRPPPAPPPVFGVAGTFSGPTARRRLKQRALGRFLPGSGCPHAAAFLEPLRHRRPDDSGSSQPGDQGSLLLMRHLCHTICSNAYSLGLAHRESRQTTSG